MLPYKLALELDDDNYILVDTINFNHKLNYPKLKELSKFLINKKYQDKKSKYNIQIIKKCFLHLYENYEKTIIEFT